jgi:TPP-dependent pyruvate/acetoin dehydrogenase alpha subunit
VGEREILDAMNTAIGQGAGAVGAWMVLREDDYMKGNYGSHGHPSGKGDT